MSGSEGHEQSVWPECLTSTPQDRNVKYMETISTYQNHGSSFDQEAIRDEFTSFMKVIDAVKGVYDEGVRWGDRSTRALLGRDLATTKTARDRVLDEMIYNAVHCATKVRLIDGEPDPTLMDFTEVMEILFVKATTNLVWIMSHAKLAAFLRDLAQCLDDKKFDGNIIRSMMSK